MKKLFYLLLCLPLAFAACEQEPAPKPEVKDPVLKLTSNETVRVAAEGAEIEVTYTLENAKQGVEFTAECDADWITNFTFGETIKFEVAANDGAERETKVAFKYDVASMEITVKQAEKNAEPEPGYYLEGELTDAERFPSSEEGLDDNYYLLGFKDKNNKFALAIVLADPNGQTILPAGNYTSDDETILTDLCALIYGENEDDVITFNNGDITVAVDGENYSLDITLWDNKENAYHFTYEGEIENMNSTVMPEPQDFNPVKVEAYRADSWDLGNFELDLYIDETNYHSLDMQDLTNPNDKYLSEGNYTIANGGVTSWSNFLWNIETGEGAYVVDAEIALSHNDDGTSTIVGFIESEYGDHLDIDWTGVVEGFTLD
jgi:hypothetical protein